MVSKVVIVGRDAPLWLSALALYRALKPAGVTVEVVALPDAMRAEPRKGGVKAEQSSLQGRDGPTSSQQEAPLGPTDCGTGSRKGASETSRQ